VLGRHRISIASVIQHEATDALDGYVPLVIMTHAASEGAAEAAVREIDQLKVVRAGTVRLRVLGG
jgi:homoserine dehydrogenase